jgi:hypothetical protein
MRFSWLLRALVLVVTLPGAVSASDGWSQLKAGMTRGEAVELLGAEVVASRARGFEVAIYDEKAEVVFLDGQVVAWTAPVSSNASPAPTNTWQFAQTPRARANAATTSRVGGARPGNGRILPAYRL